MNRAAGGANGRHRVTVAELQDSSRYRCLIELDQESVGEFVLHYYFRRRNWLTVSHYLLSLALVAAWGWSVIAAGEGSSLFLKSLALGFAAFLLIVPLHEALHALVYRLTGAQDVRFRLSKPELYAYVIAHNFVVNQRGFTWVALAPFLVINALLAALIFILPDLRPYLLAVLLFHVSGCSGDWALLSYLWENREKEVLTYDNAETGKSYFYERLRRN
ncbi:MAG: DUF3267 domain-containing protein [Chloroflexi bacterium]|jgi:hypothetical protein|nr:DUF3267 domain-containing protein [Chloroflexota bacterium]